MASDPGGDAANIDTPPPSLPHDAAAHNQRDHDQKMDTQQKTSRPAAIQPQSIPPVSARIPGDEVRAPRSRIGELHRRRSQILYSGSSSEPTTRGTGVQKPTARPPEQASALRRHGSLTDLYRSGAATAATRERMYQMLATATSSERLAPSPTPPTRTNIDDKQKDLTMTTRPIAIPRTRRPVDVEMLDASMPPPPPPAASTTTNSGSMASGAFYSSIPPPETRNELGVSSSGAGGSLKRSASSASNGSNSSQTVTIIECPILEVDEQCGNDEDLSWLNNDKELEQMLSVPPSSYRRAGRSSLAFRRSQEAAMQCSQVVRNVPRMRKRRDRKLDHRRQSMTLSESTICLSSSPSPTATPVG